MSGTTLKARVLVVDDDLATGRIVGRMLELEGYEVAQARSVREARTRCAEGEHDVLVSDVCMPGECGVDLLRELAVQMPDLPVVLMTAHTSIDVIEGALEHGAFHFLRKPIGRAELVRTVGRAVSHRRERAEADEALTERRERQSAEYAMQGVFEKAMDTLWMAYQPIVDRDGRVFGHEALMRTRHREVPHPGVMLDLARALDRLRNLGRRTRELAPLPFADGGGELFVNLLPSDLEDEALYDPRTPLGQIADRVILELTERAPLSPGPVLANRLARLRSMGFRFAIDDLGAGYAGLSSLALVEPEIVKIDRSLVDHVDESPTRQRLVRAMTTLCAEQGTVVLGEGVERAEEAECLAELGCTLFQGYFFARPGPAFPEVTARSYVSRRRARRAPSASRVGDAVAGAS